MNEKQNKRLKFIAMCVAIILIIIALVFGVSKFILKDKFEGTALNFNQYRIGQQEITYSPTTYTGGDVTVTISASVLAEVNSGKTGNDIMKIQYSIAEVGSNPSANENDWTLYTTPFTVSQNSTVHARLVTRGHTDSSLEMDYTGPVTSVDITNIAVAQIGANTYKTLAGAIQAWENLTTQEKQTSTIEMLANTSENITIPQLEEIKLDLCGYDITGASSATPTITVNGTLNIIDSGKTDNNVTTYGKVVSTANTAIKVTGANSKLILGTNESAGGVDNEQVNPNGPVINGGTGSQGVLTEQGGSLEFYDGKITAPLQAGTNTAIMVNNTAVGNANTNLVTVPTGYRLDLSDDTTAEKEIATVIRKMTVSFDTDGGTPSNIADIEVGEGKPYNKYASWPSDPTKTGYTFAGWNGKNLFDRNNIVDLAIAYSGEIVWNSAYIGYYLPCNPGDVFSLSRNELTNNRFRVVFTEELPAQGVHYFGGTGLLWGEGTDYESQLKIENIVAPENANYIFIYLSNQSDELPSNIQLEKGSTATDYEPYIVTPTTPVTQTQNHTLKAIWTANTYSVRFNANNGTGTMADQSMTYGTSANLTANSFTRTGYSFAGWNTSADGSGTSYTDGQSVSNLTATDNAIVDLYAQWTPNTYTVTYDYDGATSGNTDVSKTVTYSENYGTLPDPTKTGYTFAGWNGKNKFNMNKWLSSFSTATNGTVSIQDGSVTLTATGTDAYTNSYGRESSYKIPVKPNTNYVISWKSNNYINGYLYVFINNKYTSNYMFCTSNAVRKYMSFITPEDASYITVRVGVNNARTKYNLF